MVSNNALNWLETLLYERFGIDLRLTYRILGAQKVMVLSLYNAEGSIIFDFLEPAFQQSSSDFPCESWSAITEGFESILEEDLPAPTTQHLRKPLIEKKGSDYYVHYDILGLTYWMLTRLEEVGRKDLDEHERFPAVSSHAFNFGYLERPIVDEWLHVLGQVFLRLWPQIRLKQHQFSMQVSHDVDAPARYGFINFFGLVRTIGADLIKRKNLKSALRGGWIWFNGKADIHPLDPVNTFDWIMKQSELNGLTSAFYFICGRTDFYRDAFYEPESLAIRNLMKSIHARGHEIGLHPSYHTYLSPKQIKLEADRLRMVCKNETIMQKTWGGRMHYLRWNPSVTLKAWEDAGMDYDSTLGYADRPGFRCGTCHEYTAFDLVNDQKLKLRIRPLIAMDCTIISESYLGLGSTEAAYKKFADLKRTCMKVGGIYTLLWHNSFFNCSMDFSIYQRLIKTP